METRSDQTLAVAPAWVEAHCVVPDRFRRGAPFRLYDYQLRYFAAFYLVKGSARWNPQDPVLGPAFVYRRGMLIGPQKIGKGPHTATHVCLEGVGPALFAGWAERGDGYACDGRSTACACGWEYEYEPGEPMGMAWPTPLIQITAFSEEQTENVYGVLRPMIEYGPLGDVIRKTGEEFIRLPGGGRVDRVTSSAQSRLGQRITFAPQDEVGLYCKANKMDKVADTQYRGLAGMGGRASLSSNAWDPSENSVAQQQYESNATDIYRQFKQPPPHLSYKNKAERRKIHRIAYEGALKDRGGHIDLDSVEAEATDLLQRDPEQAERFFGNRIVHGKGSWQPDELWPATLLVRPTPLAGVEVCAGFDGSDSNDWTGIRLRTRDGWRFTPTYGPDSRPTCWNPAEWGGSIPRGEVMAAWDEIFRRYKVIRAYCDPRDWQSEIGDLALQHGEDVVREWPTYRIRQMCDALKRSVNDLVSGRSIHDDCPITAAHVANARKIAKPGDLYILAKPNDHQKIDMAMADVLCHEAGEDALADGWGAPKAPNWIYTA
jgi:hypothetical protein